MSDKGAVKVTVKDSNDLVVRRLKDKGHRGINVLQWDLEVDRDVELGRQLKKAKEEIDKIKEEISKLDKPADKDAQEEQSKDDKMQEPDRQSDESDDEKEKAPTDKKKDREKRSKLNLDLRNAKLEVEKIKKVMDEPKTYGDLPKDTRENMIRKIYVSGGKYTVEVKSGKESHSVTLQVKPAR